MFGSPEIFGLRVLLGTIVPTSLGLLLLLPLVPPNWLQDLRSIYGGATALFTVVALASLTIGALLSRAHPFILAVAQAPYELLCDLSTYRRYRRLVRSLKGGARALRREELLRKSRSARRLSDICIERARVRLLLPESIPDHHVLAIARSGGEGTSAGKDAQRQSALSVYYAMLGFVLLVISASYLIGGMYLDHMQPFAATAVSGASAITAIASLLVGANHRARQLEYDLDAAFMYIMSIDAGANAIDEYHRIALEDRAQLLHLSNTLGSLIRDILLKFSSGVADLSKARREISDALGADYQMLTRLLVPIAVIAADSAWDCPDRDVCRVAVEALLFEYIESESPSQVALAIARLKKLHDESDSGD